MFSWNGEQKKRVAMDPRTQPRLVDSMAIANVCKNQEDARVAKVVPTQGSAYDLLSYSLRENTYTDATNGNEEPQPCGSFAPSFNVPPAKNKQI